MTQMQAGQGGAPSGGQGLPTFSFKPMEEAWTGETKADDKTMGLLCHLLGIVGFLGPLIIWLIKKGESKYADVQGKEALNFQLSVLIYAIVLGTVTCGILAPVVWVFNIVMVIIGSMKANNMIVYRYPLAIRFIK